MPSKSSELMSQSELGAYGLRESARPRPDSTAGSRGGVAAGGSSRLGQGPSRLRQKTSSSARISENFAASLSSCSAGVGGGRRSPRLGGGASTRPPFSYAAPNSQRTHLGDITNRQSSTSALSKVKQLQASDRFPSMDEEMAPPLAPAPAPLGDVAPRSEPAKQQLRRPSVPLFDGAAAVAPLPSARSEVAQINVQSVSEYAPDIYNQMFKEETLFLPRGDYLEKVQTDITGKMRTILVDWLVEVHMKYKLRSESLHLSINLIDRYLTHKPVMRKRLQLVGVAAMFIASKYEEIHPPELHDWVYITDNAYTQDDVLSMECQMLTTLNFNIMVPTAAHFFDMLQQANNCDTVQREIAQYVLELGLLEAKILQYTPSQLVSAALLLSNELTGRSPWPAAMVQQSRQSEAAIRPAVSELRALVDADRVAAANPQQGQLQAVHKKFADKKKHSVSLMSFAEMMR